MKRSRIFSLTLILMIAFSSLASPAAALARSPRHNDKHSGPQTYTVVVGAENSSWGITVNAFFPENLRIHVGDTVVWNQNSFEIHTVTFLAGEPLPDLLVPFPLGPAGAMMLNPMVAFPTPPTPGYDGSTFANSGVMSLEAGQPRQFSLTFTKAGTYDYVCVVHGVSMSGKIEVVDPSVGVTSPKDVSRRAQKSIKKGLEQGKRVYFEALSTVPHPTRNTDGSTTYHVQMGYNKGQIDLMDFFPRMLTVQQGDTVEWTMSASNMAPHTVTFLNGAPEPSFIVPVPNLAGGPPFLVINPDVALPQNAAGPLTGTGIYNSGLMVPGMPSYSLKIGDVSGTVPYLCLLHDTSGMVGQLKVVSKKGGN
jgi:plastocyanin